MQQKKQQNFFFDTFNFRFLFWKKNKKFSSELYQIQKMLQIIEKTLTKKQNNLMLNLLFKLNIFKRQIKRHIFLLKIFKKIITIIIEKQSSFAIKKNRRQKTKQLFWHYWYHFINFINTIFSTTKLRKKMHFDMICYANESTKLWYLKTWNFSMRLIFDDVCYIFENELIISNDILNIDDEIFFFKFASYL